MSELIELTVTNGIPTTTSLAVAEKFGKRHDNVLQSIEKLECSEAFRALNFQESSRRVEVPNGGFRLQPMYAITKDGFVFLAMGFTGKEAAAWKERYIAAFNAMERQLLENAAQAQVPKDDGQQFLSHRADIMVAADRTFRSILRSSRTAGMKLPAALRRAHEVTLQKTGVSMLDELQAHEHLAELDARQAQGDAAGWQGSAATRASQEPVARFFRDWSSGVLGLPYQVCQTRQAYRAYQHWCRGAQVRFVSSQMEFTQRMLRYANALGQPLRLHQVRLHAHTDDEVITRIVLTHDIPFDQPIGTWATELVNQFEAHLDSYCGTQARADATV